MVKYYTGYDSKSPFGINLILSDLNYQMKVVVNKLGGYEHSITTENFTTENFNETIDVIEILTSKLEDMQKEELLGLSTGNMKEVIESLIDKLKKHSGNLKLDTEHLKPFLEKQKKKEVETEVMESHIKSLKKDMDYIDKLMVEISSDIPKKIWDDSKWKKTTNFSSPHTMRHVMRALLTYLYDRWNTISPITVTELIKVLIDNLEYMKNDEYYSLNFHQSYGLSTGRAKELTEILINKLKEHRAHFELKS